MRLLKRIKDRLQGKTVPGVFRSGKWETVRKDFLLKNPRCAVCNGIRKLEVHHMLPFHLFSQKELDPKNLITLCEDGIGHTNCHLIFGHLGNFKNYNKTVVEDSRHWFEKFK